MKTSDFHTANEKLDELIRSELTALEQGVTRLRELLQIHGEGHGPIPKKDTDPKKWRSDGGYRSEEDEK